MDPCSILFLDRSDTVTGTIPREPDNFRDLNLDQIVAAVAALRPDHAVAMWFYVPLRRVEAVRYRQEVMRDLDDEALFLTVSTFARRMHRMRVELKGVTKSYYRYEKAAGFLSAVATYCSAVTDLAHDLTRLTPQSLALRQFRDSLGRYVQAAPFGSLRDRSSGLKSRLAAIRYALHIQDGSVTVRDLTDELDYARLIEESFAQFRGSEPIASFQGLPRSPGMNGVEAEILERVARLHPETFRDLRAFCEENVEYAVPLVLTFDREIQFYLGYLEYIAPLRRAGLSFCYPRISEAETAIQAREAFDLALARSLLEQTKRVVRNDLTLRSPERILVVSGPNQGGKTTFARMVGQLHELARLGCRVPGSDAQLLLCDRVFCLFERAEDLADLRGKLQDDLVRVHQILLEATSQSLIILNELFGSTTLEDALYLSRRIMEKLCERQTLGVWVTFLDELADLNDHTVSLVSGVDARDPTVRTFKVERRAPDGLAYTLALAAKHRVTYEDLRRRLRT
jgi:DNA mismatch repair protein MutS